MEIKQTYQKIIQYAKILREAVRDVYEQDILELDSKQIYERRKLGDRFPRPLEGLEAKI